jgi:hypothetical protein
MFVAGTRTGTIGQNEYQSFLDSDLMQRLAMPSYKIIEYAKQRVQPRMKGEY